MISIRSTLVDSKKEASLAFFNEGAKRGRNHSQSGQAHQPNNVAKDDIGNAK